MRCRFSERKTAVACLTIVRNAPSTIEARWIMRSLTHPNGVTGLK
ncbi:hypothetical protein QUB80_26680 [Chlorogloeopsis sp. ULAP01]|nr:hypothetical protein [Chlorogloeopsis sp. ULAP01]MDM9384266.1 hypothetical protein [Chlorogloeopsis sp. ULAP01]